MLKSQSWQNRLLQETAIDKSNDTINDLTRETSIDFIKKLSQIVQDNNFWWDEPLVNVNEYLEVVFEWWHQNKKITIYIKDDDIDYLKVWGADIDNEMENGKIETKQDIESIWQWINE